MSGIAGIIRFDGAPVEPGQVEKMTAAMVHRGPDGIHHWVRGSVALGQCMLRTTPESLEETQPLTNEDASLVLVMDGRVDNWEELRRELLGRGAVLRTRADAELVLRAYEIWGEACPDRIIGEFTFFIWDARQRRLFAARDAAGTRHFYFYAGNGWFAFASEIKSLLALDCIEPKLNESRLLDYLVPEFDRDDVVGTFYQGIDRMPAGNAMTVSHRGVKPWRYWNPGGLPENRFASLDECAEAFLDQLRVAVKCRLRSIGPVGAMLSGGLDSSSIVGLIRKEFRNELSQPLQTFSLIREDRENCKDWEHIQHFLKDGWVVPTVIPSSRSASICRPYLDGIQAADEPFMLSHGLANYIAYQAAHERGCSVVLEGMAGDLLFYRLDKSRDRILQGKMFSKMPALISAYRRHGVDDWFRAIARQTLVTMVPGRVRTTYRKYRDSRVSRLDDLRLLRPEFTKQLMEKRRQCAEVVGRSGLDNEQSIHARIFTSGMLSFAHELYGESAFSRGVEPRSPFSDRRMIEFAVQMPLEAKLSGPWYKNTLREGMSGILPDKVRWRRDIGNHPGWKFHEQFICTMSKSVPDVWNLSGIEHVLNPWIDGANLRQAWHNHARGADYLTGVSLFTLVMLAQWISSRDLKPSIT